MIRIPTDREPSHPGEMLREEFLIPMAISQKVLADAIHVPYQRINELINQKRGVTPSTALRLGKFFATGAAAKSLADGFSCKLAGGKAKDCGFADSPAYEDTEVVEDIEVVEETVEQ